MDIHTGWCRSAGKLAGCSGAQRRRGTIGANRSRRPAPADVGHGPVGFACDRGLQMLLILIDAEEHLETRELAGECCEERLQSELVQDYVANRLHQQPLPKDTDILTALRLAQQHTWTRTQALLNEIAAAQPVLKDLLDSLKNLPDNIIESAGWPTRTFAARQLLLRWRLC